MVLLLNPDAVAKFARLVYNSGSFLILRNIQATQLVAFGLNAAAADVR